MVFVYGDSPLYKDWCYRNYQNLSLLKWNSQIRINGEEYHCNEDESESVKEWKCESVKEWKCESIIPQRGKVMTAPTVPPLKANVTNLPFSDSGTHLRQKYPMEAKWDTTNSTKHFLNDHHCLWYFLIEYFDCLSPFFSAGDATSNGHFQLPLATIVKFQLLWVTFN